MCMYTQSRNCSQAAREISKFIRFFWTDSSKLAERNIAKRKVRLPRS